MVYGSITVSPLLYEQGLNNMPHICNDSSLTATMRELLTIDVFAGLEVPSRGGMDLWLH